MFDLAWHTVVLVFGLMAIAPVRFGDLASHPHPVVGYDACVAQIGSLQAAEDSFVARGGRSILLTHGKRTPRVYVLFHGLTDSPLQFLPFAQQLFDRGDNVFIPRVPLHAERAGSVRRMAHLTAQQWRDLGDRSVDVAQGLGDSVIVAGLSAGGTVAAWAAQYRPEVRRAVLIAPALDMARMPQLFHGSVVRIAMRVPNVWRSQARDTTEPDRLPGWTTHSLVEMLMLANVVRHAASTAAPYATETAFLLNQGDRTISNRAALDLGQQWSDHGARVRVYQLPDSLRLPHDMIDPRHPGSDTAAVYPVLAALVTDRPAPPWTMDLSTSIHPTRRNLASSSPAPPSAFPAQRSRPPQ